MKPLTIEQLKALKAGDWIWIVKIGDGRLKSDYAGYFEIAKERLREAKDESSL